MDVPQTAIDESTAHAAPRATSGNGLSNTRVQERLLEKFGDSLQGFEEPHGLLTVTAPAAMNLKVLQFLYDDEEMRFRFLTHIAGVHYPDRKGEELCVVYHIHNLQDNLRLRLKVYVPSEQPDVFTASQLFPGANWMERETYDYYGVNFVGHPNLRRILNVDEMDYFPMRKEYALEDGTRRDKDDEMFGRTGRENRP